MTKWIDLEQLTHAIKTVIACLIGAVISFYFHFESGPWIVISILVVMTAQIFVGSVLQKAYLRLLGTIIGTLIASITLAIYGPKPIPILMTIAIATFFFSYLATTKESLSYTGTLGAVTTTIILFAPNPTLHLAFQRSLEIGLGILIATVVSNFVFPIHARTHLRRSQITTLKRLRDYYIDCLIAKVNLETTYFQDAEENIALLLVKQRQLAKEAKRELLDRRYDPEHFSLTLMNEKQLLRSINFMHDALQRIDQSKSFFAQSSPLYSFNEAVVAEFNKLIQTIEEDQPGSNPIDLPSLTDIKIARNSPVYTPQEVLHLDGFIFGAERLIECLTNLASLFSISFQKPDFS